MQPASTQNQKPVTSNVITVFLAPPPQNAPPQQKSLLVGGISQFLFLGVLGYPATPQQTVPIAERAVHRNFTFRDLGVFVQGVRFCPPEVEPTTMFVCKTPSFMSVRFAKTFW